MTTPQARENPGTPAGGRFATQHRAEPTLDLSVPEPSAPRPPLDVVLAGDLVCDGRAYPAGTELTLDDQPPGTDTRWASVASGPQAGDRLLVSQSDLAEQRWVFIERQYGPDLAVGPFTSDDAAERCMNDSMLIQGFAEDDALDIYTIAQRPLADVERVIIDPTDTNHTAEPASPTTRS